MVETGHCFAGSTHLPLISYPDVLLTSRRRAFVNKRFGYEINLPWEIFLLERVSFPVQ